MVSYRSIGHSQGVWRVPLIRFRIVIRGTPSARLGTPTAAGLQGEEGNPFVMDTPSDGSSRYAPVAMDRGLSRPLDESRTSGRDTADKLTSPNSVRSGVPQGFAASAPDSGPRVTIP